MEQNLKNYIEDKNMVLDEITISFKEIYNLENSKVDIAEFDNYIIVCYKRYEYIFYKKIYNVEIYVIADEIKMTNDIIICSSYELFDYCQKNHLFLPYITINGQTYSLDKAFNCIHPLILGNEKDNTLKVTQDFSGFKNAIFKEVKPIASYNKANTFIPKNYSEYFDLQFKSNDIYSPFNYYISNERSSLTLLIIKLIQEPSLIILKICGPSAIGKSMTLFYFSKNHKNIMYINLKTIRELSSIFEYSKIYNLILESLHYFSLEKKEELLLKNILSNLKGYEFFDIIDKIIDFLIQNNIVSIIIFDQFKEGNIDIDKYKIFKTKLKNQITVKLILCASTNDKSIREQLIEDWKSKNFQNNKIPPKVKECSFYIDNLNIKKDIEIKMNIYDIILGEFNYLPKYIIIFNNLQKKNADFNQLVSEINSIENKLQNNIFSLYEKIITTNNAEKEDIYKFMINCLKKIDGVVGKKMNYSQLENIVSICSIKYMKFHFEKEYFTVDYCFNFYRTLVQRLIDQEVSNFFQKNKDKKHTGHTVGDYFELLSSKALFELKLKLPNYQKDKIELCVDEIVKMRKIVNDLKNILSSNLVMETILKKYEVSKNELIKEFGNNDNTSLFNELRKLIFIDDGDIITYKRKYINSLKNNYTIDGTDKYADLNIYIKQKTQIGKTIDYCYLTGEKDKKKLFTFQMKAYNEKTSTDFNETKKSIKNKLKEMLINCKFLLGVTIVDWHYIVVILVHKIKDTFKYSTSLVKKCISNGLEFIFFEPFIQKFYNRNLEVIDKFEGSQFSNLSCELNYYYTKPFREEELYLLYLKTFTEKYEKKNKNQRDYLGESINNFLGMKLERETISKCKINLSNIISDISNELNLTNIKFLGSYKLLDNLLPRPNYGYLFLYHKKKPNINGKADFIILYTDNKGLCMIHNYDTINKKIEQIYDLSDIDKDKFFYVFIILSLVNIHQNNENNEIIPLNE